MLWRSRRVDVLVSRRRDVGRVVNRVAEWFTRSNQRQSSSFLPPPPPPLMQPRASRCCLSLPGLGTVAAILARWPNGRSAIGYARVSVSLFPIYPALWTDKSVVAVRYRSTAITNASSSSLTGDYFMQPLYLFFSWNCVLSRSGEYLLSFSEDCLKALKPSIRHQC